MSAEKRHRVVCISDLHIDYPENWELIKQLSCYDYQNDVLILAGDVTDSLKKLMITFECLSKKFMDVLFVPGNHELWLKDDVIRSSFEKFTKIEELALECGVLTSPKRYGKVDPLWVVPLLSWYVSPEEDNHNSLYVEKCCPDRTVEMWSDFYFTHWVDREESVSQWFLNKNVNHLNQLFDAPVISFSHFLPRAELMFADAQFPEYSLRKTRKGHQIKVIKPSINDPTPEFNFSRVAGTFALDKQLRSIKSTVHIYGHQHRNRDCVIEGVRYISHCLGYPSERQKLADRATSECPRIVGEFS